MAKVIIIGAGFSGIGMAVALKQAGEHDFVVLEKAPELGGTWRDNRYPGCACDVESQLYSFSFAPNPAWSRKFAPQQEIWDYLREIADRHGVGEHIRFSTPVSGVIWDERTKLWHVGTPDGELTARAVITAVGGLHHPSTPELPGVERFRGHSFHSSQWDEDYSLADKRVAVVGTGASAIQFVPAIAPDVASLTLFQRTPPWVLPRKDRAGTRDPVRQKLERLFVYWRRELNSIGFTTFPKIMKAGERAARRHLADQVPDAALRAKLTPDYTLGCKRVLISDDYYPALTRPNVSLVTENIAEVREHGIVDAAGVEHEVDAIIYGTGFHATASIPRLDVVGRDGLKLAEQWRTHGIETYYGVTAAGFPNLFFLLGPNTGIGHTSQLVMIEAQIRYVRQALAALAERNELEVRADVQRAHYADLQRKAVKGVWSQGGCASWYLDDQRVNRSMWPFATWRYRLRTRRFRLADYR